MISIILLLIKILVLTSTALTSDTSDNDILPGFQFQEVEFTTTEMAAQPTTTSFDTEITEKPQSLFLELEFEFSSREEYWKANQYRCINGTYVPSKYMRRNYKLCTRIHDFSGTSECAAFCQLAATLLVSTPSALIFIDPLITAALIPLNNVSKSKTLPLQLSEDLAPTISLYAGFYQIVLPLNVSKKAVTSVTNCFERFGNNLNYFKDCKRPQRFFRCVEDISSQMVC